MKTIKGLLLCICFLSVNVFAADYYWPLEPVWNSDAVKGESLLFVKTDKAIPEDSLLFNVEKVIRIYHPATGKVFVEGQDYTYKPGTNKICLTEKTNIPFIQDYNLCKKPGSLSFIKGCIDGKRDIFFNESHFFHDIQVEVDYVHSSDAWSGYVPKFSPEQLPKTMAKLLNKEPFNLVIYGDSISNGTNVSAKTNVKPYMLSYGGLVELALENIYGVEIQALNLSKCGQITSHWGVRNIGKVIDAKPDLVIIAWGMNDALLNVDTNQYGMNIKSQIDAIKKANKDTEIILVSAMYGNPECTVSAVDLYPLYLAQLKELCGDGVVLADVSSVSHEVLKRKAFPSITGNGVNQPNDFGHRLYAQTILSLLVKDTKLLANAVSKINYPNRNDTDISRELLKDRHFKNGFNVLNPTHGMYVINGQIGSDGSPSVWMLAQWHSDYDITGTKPEILSDGGVKYSNVAKSVILHHNGSDIILELNSVVENDGKLRKEAQGWPHLLIEQKITNCPNLSELKGLDLNITAKILKSKTFKIEGYTKMLHAGHIPFVITVNNKFGDFFWLLVPIYDDRCEFSEEWISQDIASPTAKLVYGVATKKYSQRSLHCGEWVNINCDLLPIILEAMNVNWEKGYLRQCKNIKDYHITSMNLGWEVPGLNEVKIAIKDLSLKAVTAK